MRRPGAWLAGVAAYLALLLYADRFVGIGGQAVLGVLTAGVLIAALRRLPAALRVQTLLVVCVATVGELIGSIVWGLYTYRLENLPPFVPPAHGLVYLGGVALAALARSRPRVLVWGAAASVAAWGAAGITVLSREDLAGALGAATLVVFLLRGRAPAVYAGVFAVVAALELYGTALGTWTWAPTTPGLPLSQGNPPSGIAAGYVLFDVVALALAPALLTVAERVRRTRAVPAPPLPGPARSA